MQKTNIFKLIFGFLAMVFGGLQGGQGKIGGKNLRRYGMPLMAATTAVAFDGFQWKDLVFLLCIPVLAMGYGVDSYLGAILWHIEWLIRLSYAILLSLPFLFYGLLRWSICAALLILVFQIHAGSLGRISWFGDILIEDLVRYGMWASMVIMCIVWKNRRNT